MVNRYSQFIKITALQALVVFLLTGCVTYERPKPGDPYYAPTATPTANLPQQTEGSLYRGEQGLSLFTDRKALSVGDVITITLNERTVSSKSANVEIDKESNLEFDAGPLLGGTPNIRGSDLGTDLESTREFQGESEADQSNSLQGNISVTVAEVLPNGGLVVRGEKWITINRGAEYIRISGIVRPDDVSPDNTVPSTRLANAQITYSGTGELASSQSMGWLTRFFNSPIWPL